MINLEKTELILLKNILEKYVPNYTVWLFGSRATPHIKPHSDIDVVIMTQTPLDIHTFSELSLALSDSDLPYKVDLIDWSVIDDDFKKIIQKQYVVIHEKHLP